VDGTIADMPQLWARLGRQLERFRDLGFDGIKLVNEWSTGRNGKWGVARPLVGLERLVPAADPWALDGEMINGSGGILAKAAELGMSVLIHGPDGGREVARFWSAGGVWDRVLAAHPGLKLTIAHGLAISSVHRGAPHQGAGAQECDAVVGMMLDLLDKHDGAGGRAIVRIELMASFIRFWVEHNQAFRAGLAATHDYRAQLVAHHRQFMLGLDPINAAAAAYQSDGCGAQSHFEGSYLSARMLLEGPYVQGSPSARFLNLVGEAGVLDHLYRQNLLAAVAAGSHPGHVGAAGVDTRGNRRVDCGGAITYVEELRDSVRTDYRRTTPASDPLRATLGEIADEMRARCP
jgi:hypothetical protein